MDEEMRRPMNENIPTGRIVGKKLSPIEELHRLEALVLSMGDHEMKAELMETLAASYRAVLFDTAGIPDPNGHIHDA